MSAQTIEERLTAVEIKMEQLEQKKEQKKEQGEEPRGWKRIAGVFADDPEFKEAVKTGKK